MSTKIFRVDLVELNLLKSNPPQLLINAMGTVSTTGWEKPELEKVKEAPIDGIYQFNFCATPPSGNVPQIIMPISVSYLLKVIPEDFKGVRINASSNSIEQTSGVEKKAENVRTNFTPQLENILGIEMVKEKLKIRVTTGGCTTKESFQVNVIKGFTGIPPYIVEIYRVIPDYCEGYFPDGIVIEYELKELGIEPFATFKLENMIGKAT